MSKVDSKTKNQVSLNVQKTENFPARPNCSPPAQKQNLPPTHFNSSREVAPLEAKYSDLLKPKEVNYKAHIVPVIAIFAFSLVLAVIFHTNSSNTGSTLGHGNRGPSGEQMSDLSNGSYQSQSADYQEEKTCVDHPDGTKSCTTKTKLHRSFR